MSIHQWLLSDSDHDGGSQYRESFAVGKGTGDLGHLNVRVDKQTLQSGLSDGVELLTVHSGDLQVSILPTRGMSLWKARRDDFEFGWQSPVRGPVHPKFVPLTEPGGLGWLDGFDELMVRCGLESNGAPGFDADGRLAYPLHGRIGNKPAGKVEVSIDDDNEEVVVTGVVHETRFHFAKYRMTTTYRFQAGSNRIEIQDEIENLSASETTMQMLYHVNFGTPLLDAGSRFVAPLREVVPRNDHAASGIDQWQDYSAPEPGFEEQVYFLTLHADDENRSKALLKNAHSMHGAMLDFDITQLPCFSVWKNTTALEDGYVTGIEPGTNYPNPREFESDQGRVVTLGPRQSTTFDVGLSLLVGDEEVTEAESAVDALMTGKTTTTHSSPQPGWCADA